MCLLHTLEARCNCTILISLRFDRRSTTALNCIDRMLLESSNQNADGTYPGPKQLTVTNPASVCSLKNLDTFELHETVGITGTIPDCFGLSSLTLFAAQGNSLDGLILQSLCSASDIAYLILASNRLVGPLDPCFACLSTLSFKDGGDLYAGFIGGGVCVALFLAVQAAC